MEEKAKELVAATQTWNLPARREIGCTGMVIRPLEESIVMPRGTLTAVKRLDN